MENSVFILQNFGKISFAFGKVMDEKQINRNQLAKRAGIRFEVANRFYNGDIERLDIDVLAKICFVLDCDVADVISFERPATNTG